MILMYICICQSITDREIRACVEDGARNMRDLRECLGVASQCGRCAREARAILREAKAETLGTVDTRAPLAA